MVWDPDPRHAVLAYGVQIPLFDEPSPLLKRGGRLGGVDQRVHVRVVDAQSVVVHAVEGIGAVEHLKVYEIAIHGSAFAFSLTTPMKWVAQPLIDQ